MDEERLTRLNSERKLWIYECWQTIQLYCKSVTPQILLAERLKGCADMASS